jgi:RsmE family RNA methyltransferase
VNLVLLETADVDTSGRVVLTGVRADHLRRVLKVVEGQGVRIGVIDGPHGIGTVTSLSGDAVVLECTLQAATAERPPVDLLLAVPRPKVLRRLWPQLAALGVGRVILTNASRVERNYFDTHFLSPDVYRPLLIEGLQQARDTRVPLVSVHRQFRILIEDHLDALSGPAARLVADPASEDSIHDAIAQRADAPGSRVLLAIGPEGGWNSFELDLLAGHRFSAVGMGSRTLRSDTACVALLALVHDALRARTPRT